VYELSESDVRNLDRFEGVAKGAYRKEMLAVDVDGRELNCLIYIDMVTDIGKPKKEYIARINNGIHGVAAKNSSKKPPASCPELSNTRVLLVPLRSTAGPQAVSRMLRIYR
jgi:hypothetical protein